MIWISIGLVTVAVVGFLSPAAALIGIGCILLLALIDPKFMRWLCARGLGWAASFEAFKANRVEETHFWESKLGIAESGPQLVRQEEREA